jgi:hypothetical protein
MVDIHLMVQMVVLTVMVLLVVAQERVLVVVVKTQFLPTEMVAVVVLNRKLVVQEA